MAGIGRKIASYVGIVDDRRYDEEDLPDEELTTEVYSTKALASLRRLNLTFGVWIGLITRR